MHPVRITVLLVTAAVGFSVVWVAASQAGTPPPTLIITEVLVNSGGGAADPAQEWVEIRNLTDAAIDLAGWIIEDNHARDSLPAVTLPSGGFALLVTTAGLMPARDGVVQAPIADGRIGNGLANSGDLLRLVNPDGVAVDGLSWGTDRSITDLPAPAAGQTLGRSAASAAFRTGPPTPGAWSPAAGSGAVAPPLRIVEVLPNAGRGEADSESEWVEIWNPTAAAVDLAGWQIRDNGGSDVITAGRIPAGGRVVIGGLAAVAAGVATVEVADGRIGNGLANSGDLVALTDPAGAEVDRVDFRAGPTPLPGAGRSIAWTAEGWVVNMTPSPGTEAVAPLLASLPTGAPSAAPAPVREADDGGLPAWALVALAIGAPGAALGVRALWQRRRRRP